MTNASCADCGRIVAFRTSDPSEIAECRNCGTWVKRSVEMPGIAVSVKQSSPVARKTAIPLRRTDLEEPVPNASTNTSRSARSTARRIDVQPTSSPKTSSSSSTDSSAAASSSGTLTAASVYAAIRDLQKSVNDLRVGQKKIQAEQQAFKDNQREQKEANEAIHSGQKALHSGQKQLFNQYQELHKGQLNLLETTLAVTTMPTPQGVNEVTASQTRRAPLAAFDDSGLPENGFYTTPFSSLKIPLIPFRLQDLDIDTQFADEGSAAAIPAEERSDRVGLIDGPLPEPPPFVEPEVTAEPAFAPSAAEVSPPEFSAFPEYSFDKKPFVEAEETSTFGDLEAEDESSSPQQESDSSSTAALHASPFSIEGPASGGPSSIVEEEQSSAQENENSPLAASPQPFGGKNYTHDPCELNDPFASDIEDTESTGSTSAESAKSSPFNQGLTPETLPESAKDASREKSLSQQIAAAKKQQQNSPFNPAQKDLLSEPKKSRTLPILALILILLAIIGGCLYFFTDILRPNDSNSAPAPLAEFPALGMPLPQDDPRVAEAEKVAFQFLSAKSKDGVATIIQPISPSLLTDFWEPITAPTIERFFQGRILENDRVEVDFIINDVKGYERILPLVKIAEGPFLVNWKSFAECEEATLLGLAQGTLILDSGDELTEGTVRSWIQDDKGFHPKIDLGNFQAFKLHNFTEEVVALGVVRKDSLALQTLIEAFATTELKHQGKPAIRAVLKVKLIEERDPQSKKPARLEIIEILSTNWNGKENDDIINEELPPVSAAKEVPETLFATPLRKTLLGNKIGETPASPQKETPLVNKIGETPVLPRKETPLVNKIGETPVFQVLAE